MMLLSPTLIAGPVNEITIRKSIGGNPILRLQKNTSKPLLEKQENPSPSVQNARKGRRRNEQPSLTSMRERMR